MNQVFGSDFTYRAYRRQPARVRTANEQTIAPGLTLFQIGRRGRFWEVRDAAGELICLTAYKKGAVEVVRRLSAIQIATGDRTS